jgi:hypothetical protein
MKIQKIRKVIAEASGYRLMHRQEMTVGMSTHCRSMAVSEVAV